MAFNKKFYGELLLIGLVLLVGLGLTLWAAVLRQENLEARTVTAFQDAAQDRVRLIADKLDHNRVVLHSIVAFFQSSESVNREEFATYTHQVLEDYPYIKAVSWIPNVPDSKRSEMEKAAGFTFKEVNGHEADGRSHLITAKQRSSYRPAYYVEPVEENLRILGFDVASDPARSEALMRSEETRSVIATRRVRLLQSTTDDNNSIGVVFYEPVWRNPADRKNNDIPPVGVVSSVVPLASMIEAAIQPLSYQGVNILIHDLSAENENDQLLFARSTRLKKIPREEILEDYKNRGPLLEETTIDVDGRQWKVTILPARGYFQLGLQTEAISIFLGGIIFTGLLFFYMLSRLKENERIVRQVEDRTRELSKAKHETEMILLSTLDGVLGLDASGNITFCNPMTTQLLGYSKKELIGQSHHHLLHHKYSDGASYGLEKCPITQIIEYGRSCNVRDEVFWRKDGHSLQVEYTGSPIFEGDQVVGAVMVFRDIAERRALERKMEHMAQHDHLTSLANRALFIEHLEQSIIQAERSRQKIGIIYVDLNDFKVLNDTMGHAAGDALLQEFSMRLRQLGENGNFPARLGGDEFTVIVENISSQEEGFAAVERLKKAMEKPAEILGQKVKISGSIGIAFYPDHAADHEALVKCADRAMYQAKKNKNLPFAVYQPEDVKSAGAG